MTAAMMVTAVMMLSVDTGLLELLHRGQLSGRSGILERCSQLIQFGGLRRISAIGGVLRRLLKPACDL